MNPHDHVHAMQACDLCGADILHHGVVVARGQQSLVDAAVDLSTVVCRHCQFVFQPELFSEKLLGALYQRDASFAFEEAEEARTKVQECLAERQSVISAALVSHGLESGAKILDVGGGRGDCCLHLVGHHQVIVADATDCVPADPRIEKVPGLFSSTLEADEFDVVVMNHVLEHVFSPTQFLLSARRVLRNDGVLVVEVPFELYTPLVARHLGDWRHVGYFCRTTLRQFLEKAGFEVAQTLLQEGCYGVRRLPVIRAVARKLATPPPSRRYSNSMMVLVKDMFAPSALVSMFKSRLVQG